MLRDPGCIAPAMSFLEVPITFEDTFRPGLVHRKGQKRPRVEKFLDSSKKIAGEKILARKLATVKTAEIQMDQYIQSAELNQAATGLNPSDVFNKSALHPQLGKFVEFSKGPEKKEVDPFEFKQKLAQKWEVDNVDNLRIFEKENPDCVCFVCGSASHPTNFCFKKAIKPDKASTRQKFVVQLLQYIDEEFCPLPIPKEFYPKVWTQERVREFQSWVKRGGARFWNEFEQVSGMKNEFENFPEYSLWRKNLGHWAAMGFPKRILTRIVNGWSLGRWTEPPHIHFKNYDQEEELESAKLELIGKLLDKGILLRCPKSFPEVVVPTFVIKEEKLVKKDTENGEVTEKIEKFRLIWDGTVANPYCISGSPRYPFVDDIMSKSPKGYYITRDWKSAFNQIPIRFDEIRKLGISFREGKSLAYAVYTSPPFGATRSPDIHWEAQRTVQDRYNTFWDFNDAMVCFADDGRLCLAPENHPQKECLEGALLFSQVFHELLGIRLGQKDTTKPANEIKFLGQDLNFELSKPFPNKEKFMAFCDLFHEYSKAESISIRELARIRGKFEALSNFSGHFLTLRLNHVIRRFTIDPKVWIDKNALKAIYNKRVAMTDELVAIFAEWVTFLTNYSLNFYGRETGDDYLIVSDAGPHDFAYFVTSFHKEPVRVSVANVDLNIVKLTSDMAKSANLLDKDPKSYITELEGLLFAFINESKKWDDKARKVFLQTDNASVFWALLRKKANSPLQANQIEQLYRIAFDKSIAIFPRWRRRDETLAKLADLGTRFQSIPFSKSLEVRVCKTFNLTRLPSRILDHIDMLNMGHLGRNVDFAKLRNLKYPNLIILPWAFPARRLRNFAEVCHMYNFRGILALPKCKNAGISALKERAVDKYLVVSRNPKNFSTTKKCRFPTLILYFPYKGESGLCHSCAPPSKAGRENAVFLHVFHKKSFSA